ncbi:MAG: thiamine pyrophosphate-dependent dehydrogenase E1 component subunit alpha [Betaproteobacteria bacterium]|nr:thiamine pyrophosphate-dependent dehydrogenase E1 component subunit alpha [Betaproteobacteria bacterium]MBI2961441.1 thiamine pyrophosphate-dependent dehydrogenase E1 component subunit alpha [Betaproteobacteria bacterium]
MLVIRHFEEELIALHAEGHARGHFHVCIGQEATAVIALSFAGPGDYLFTTHRNHGHLLARGAEPGRLYAEIMGRRDGYNGGKGGTLHTVYPAGGFHHTSSIVGGIIPIAAGTAYAARARNTGALSVCLFGDGALEEGAAPEALNIASLWKLPVLFLCENNGKYGPGAASGAEQSRTMAAYPLTDLPRAYKIPAIQVDGTDAAEVFRAASEAVAKIRRGEGPQFIEAQTVRWPGNESNWPVAPIATRLPLAWDPGPVPERQREWYRSCDPVLLFARELVARNVASREELARIEEEVLAQIDEAAKFAIASPLPDPAEALRDVFAPMERA